MVPIANILHQETIRRLSGDGAFDRGRTYFNEGRVTDVQRKDGSVNAKVRGTRDPYAVRIWMKDESLAYSCSCPQGQEQAFCKHAVAVALASVTNLDAVAPAVAPAPAPAPTLARAKTLEPTPAVAAAAPSPPPAPAPPAPPAPAPASASAPAPAAKGSLAAALRALSKEELVVLLLEAALDDDAFRARLVDRLRGGA